MEPTILVAALLAIVAALLLFSLATLLGVWLVRVMRLPLDLPAELRLAPAPPPFAAQHTVEEARAIAGRQERLGVVHRQAYEAAAMAEQCLDLAAQARGQKSFAVVQSAANRARTAAEAADWARALADDAAAASATSAQLELARAAWQEATSAFGPTKRTTLRYWVLAGLMLVLLAMWTVILIMRHAAAP